uniref:Zona pellucida sperm-binding protein 1/4 Ig-like domain-containing protein n=1 Tax=Echeneis naucrates TaxID=173247 RepID=A0A665W183_ECHNA
MASSARDPNLLNNRRLRQTDREGLHSTHGRPQQDCREGNIKRIGRFYIIGHLEPNIPNVGYQSDSAVSVQAEAKARGQRLRGTEESWQRLQPVVECGERAMSLIIRRRRAVQLLLDRENESSVALSKLPPQCGYSVQTTWRDLTLMADYDACHVTQEEDNYVLPLLWRGIPVKMSCPVAQLHPHTSGISSLCCSLYGMTIKVQGQDPAELKINGKHAHLFIHSDYTY